MKLAGRRTRLRLSRQAATHAYSEDADIKVAAQWVHRLENRYHKDAMNPKSNANTIGSLHAAGSGSDAKSSAEGPENAGVLGGRCAIGITEYAISHSRIL